MGLSLRLNPAQCTFSALLLKKAPTLTASSKWLAKGYTYYKNCAEAPAVVEPCEAQAATEKMQK